MYKEKIEMIIAEIGFRWCDGRLLNQKDQIICNFFPIVIASYKELNGENKIYEIELQIGVESQSKHTIRDKELNDIDYPRLSTKCVYGINMSLGHIKRILQYIVQVQISTLPTEKILISRIGWNELPGGELVYCTGGTIISNDEHSDIEIDKSVQKRFQVNTLEIKLRKTFKVCKRFLEMQCPTITVLILVSVVACLRNLFVRAGVIPHFVTYLYGSTGTYKTTLAKYFSYLYGEPMNLGGLFGELESTNAALEEVINLVSDACIVVDDIAPCQKNKNTKEKKEKAASLIRKATSGTSTRKCIGRKVMEITYDGMLVLTAEELLETISTVNRMILLDTDKYKVDSEVLCMMQKNPDFACSLQLCVINWAVQNSEKIMAKIRKCFKKHRGENELSSEDKSFNRVYESFNILRIAWNLLKMCGEYYGVCQLEEKEEDVTESVKRVIYDEKKTIKKMELSQDKTNLINILYEIISENGIDIASNKLDYQTRLVSSENSNNFGLWHKGALYLDDEPFVSYVNNKYQLQLTKNQFRKTLIREGLIIKDKSGKPTKKLNGKHFVVVDYEGLKELCD